MGKGEGEGQGSGAAEWKHSTFSCFGDIGTCLFGYCCLPCQIGQTAESVGDNCFVCGVLSCFIPCITLTMVRGKVRETYGIEGGLVEDALCVCCCGPCVSCQSARQVKD